MSSIAPALRSENSPLCKVCDRGALILTRIYRMSLPVIVIGYILLIPSILGMLAGTVVFFGIYSFSADQTPATTSVQPAASGEDVYATARQGCVQGSLRDGIPGGLSVAERFCECGLTEIEASHTGMEAKRICKDKLATGSLDELDEVTKSQYSMALAGDSQITPPAQDSSEQVNPWINFFRFLAGGLSIVWIVGFFVSGLLGWLLVMRKRVLQCSTCGAVVNAS